MTDEFDEIADPDFLLKAIEEAGAAGARKAAYEAQETMLRACKAVERQVTQLNTSTQILGDQKAALKEASQSLWMTAATQIIIVTACSALLLFAAGAAYHYVIKPPKEVNVFYGCVKGTPQKCEMWKRVDIAK